MAHKIPKIQYLNTSFTANRSNGSPTLTTISDTSLLEEGMVVVGTGIPTGAVILSKTSTTVTLDKNATSTATGGSFNAYFELVFQYPPIEPKGEIFDPKERVSVALSGERQVSIDFIEGERDFKFSFLSETIKLLFEAFFTEHAIFGRVFRYFDDQNSMSYVEYELSKFKWDPTKITSRGTSAYVWSVPLSVRRVV